MNAKEMQNNHDSQHLLISRNIQLSILHRQCLVQQNEHVAIQKVQDMTTRVLHNRHAH